MKSFDCVIVLLRFCERCPHLVHVMLLSACLLACLQGVFFFFHELCNIVSLINRNVIRRSDVIVNIYVVILFVIGGAIHVGRAT